MITRVDLLRHLRFFAAVAEHRHFGHAADALGMTQPPVSQGVQRLERHLGQRLFHRDARGVRLTEVGSTLLPAVRRLLDDADHLVASAHRWRPATQVRLGVAGDLEDRVPAVIASLAAAGWDIAPTVGGTVDLVEALRGGELDVAVARHPAVVDGLRAGPVLNLPAFVWRPEAQDSPAPVTLMGRTEPLIVPPRRHHPAAHDQLVDALRRLGHSGSVLEAETPTERQAWASAGHGLRLVLDPRLGAPADGLPPLRVRVLAPTPADRRPDVDHDSLVARLEQQLR